MQTETQHALDNIKQSIELLKRHLNLEEAQTRILKIEETSSAVGFWNDPKNAQNLMREKTTLENNKLQSFLTKENVLLMRGDWTKRDEKILNFIKSYRFHIYFSFFPLKLFILQQNSNFFYNYVLKI